MNILGKLFGSDKATEKIVDATVKGVDSLFFTREEGIEKLSTHLKDMTPFKLMQRLLVLSILFVFLFSFLIALGFIIAYGLGFEKGETIAVDISELVVSWKLGFAFVSIITVYVSGGVIKLKK